MDGNQQFMMFSATFPKDDRKSAKQYISADYIRIRVGRTGSTTMNVIQQVSYMLLFDFLLVISFRDT